MKNEEILKKALEHEEEAVELYRDWAQQAGHGALQDMLEQFSMNESWHAAAVRAKLEALMDQQDEPTE